MTGEKVARKDIVDNSRLEELIDENADYKSDCEFLEIFKDSRLFMPVFFRKVIPAEGIFEEQFGIEMHYLPAVQANAVALFTNLQLLERIFPEISSIAISMDDLAEMLRQSDSCREVWLNMKVHIPLDEFLELFGIVANNRMGDMKIEGLDGLCEDEIREKLLASDVIVPCCDDIHGTVFFVNDDSKAKTYFAVCTDLDEYNKVFSHEEELYPRPYHFSQLLDIADYMVLNPASESLVIDSKRFKE